MLDEPTNGLDPQGTREVRSLVRSLAGEGTTVFVSSHLLAEIEQICTHAAVMSNGNLVAQGTLDELRRVGAATLRLRTPDAALARDGARAVRPVPSKTAQRGRRRAWHVRRAPCTAPDAAAPEAIVAALVAGRRAGARVRRRVGEPGGPLRGAHGGGVQH